MRDDYDYIIVGAGSAGCVLAARLTEDPEVSVLLVEAGTDHRSLWLTMPSAFYWPLTNERFNWAYESEPEAQLQGRRIAVPRGRVLGGSSSINGMVWIRGNAADYDNWARDAPLGEWSYAHCLPYFRCSERRDAGDDFHHGADGPLGITSRRGRHPLNMAFLEAAAQAGFARSSDVNGEQQEGFGFFDASIGGGCRSSTARGYLQPARARPGLQVLTGMRALRVTLSGPGAPRAEGVELAPMAAAAGGAVTRVHARREVILCAGAIDSPKLLMLSGIGRGAELRRHGVAVRAELPGVGANLQDHLGCNVRYRCRVPITLLNAIGTLAKARIGLEWLLRRDGLGASNHYEVGGFVRTRPELSYPDLQYHFIPIAVEYGRPSGDDVHGYQLRVTPGLPRSRGELRLRSANPRDPAKIHFNYLHDHGDLQDFRDGIRIAREIFATAAFDPYRGEEMLPGPSIQSDREIDRWLRETARSDYHPSCTCAMGSGAQAVVDAALRVNGVDALRVVDASVMPRIVNGNLNATTVMIAEKAADLIRGRTPLVPAPVRGGS